MQAAVRKTIQFVWPSLTMGLVCLLTWLFATDRPSSIEIDFLAISQPVTDISETLSVPDNVEPTQRETLKAQQNLRWLVAGFELQENSGPSQIHSLELSGPFSASVYLNGERIGSKGIPSSSRAGETPGPIDAVIPLTTAKDGANELHILISSHHAIDNGRALLNDFRVLPLVRDHRRPAAYYWIAITSAGVLIALFGFFAVSAFKSGQKKIVWVGAATALFLLLALAAEVSRSWVNYPYPLHDVRITILSLLTVLAGVTFTYLTTLRFEQSFTYRILASLVLIIVFSRLLPLHQDAQSMLALGLCALVVTYVLIQNSINNVGPARQILLMLIPASLFAAWQPWLFLDNGVFAIGAILLTPFAFDNYLNASRSQEKAIDNRITIQTRSGGLSLNSSDVVTIRSAGNYILVSIRTGEEYTARTTLSDLAKQLPDEFRQVHRSCIVNLNMARKVVRRTSGKYELMMDFGDPVPVSRTNASELKIALGRN